MWKGFTDNQEVQTTFQEMCGITLVPFERFDLTSQGEQKAWISPNLELKTFFLSYNFSIWKIGGQLLILIFYIELLIQQPAIVFQNQLPATAPR